MRTRAASGTFLRPRATDRRGFTMVELMITLTVLAAVMVVLMTVMYAASRSKVATSNRVESTQSARIALDMMAKDLRSAGYRADVDWAVPQKPIAYIDSLQVLINSDLGPFPDSLPDHIMGRPQAYDPAGSPKPAPLNGTTWQPPIKYRRGAETIRWTLDVNNDGKTDSTDWTDPDGLDAQRTPNRGDYVLVREVYGDSIGDVPGFNWGATERVALVQRPAQAGVPPMFNVYFSNGTKWNWSNGPVPASQLGLIDRIEVNVVSGSAKPDNKGSFATTSLTTQVSSMRNVPNFGQTTYNVDGYVFNDNVVKNGTRDAGEPGVPGASVRLSYMSTTTDINGHFLLRPAAGTYTLRHTPAPGYGNVSNPDSFVVTVGPATSRSFADTAAAGGWITSFAFNDKNGSGVFDGGDSLLRGIRVTVTPGGDVQYTNNSGYATNFAPAGSYSVAAAVPDSFTNTTPNPVTGTMSNGGSAALSFGFRLAAHGTVQGTVFEDDNRNGVQDGGGEVGLGGIWVGVTPDAGVTVVGWQTTLSNGKFSIDVPTVASPQAPYYVMCTVKPGYFPTTTTLVGPFYVSSGQVLTGKNFGQCGYQVISLNASRVLSLASADVVENDWNKKPAERAGDTDLILGADASGTDQLSVWFNQYKNTPYFNPNPSYTRTAQGSVLAMAVDTLDNTGTYKFRPDIATGTKNASGGNFFVWLTQGTSSNEGYVPTTANLSYRTSDAGDVQSILSLDCAGGTMPDLIVGTKSPTANQGTIEVWQSNDNPNPVFTQQEIYPPNGLIPLNRLGEVTAMALADFDGDGKQDLVVGTRTGDWTGQLMFFRNVSRVNGARFIYQCGYDLTQDAVTSITCFDIDGDGKADAIVGTQKNNTGGNLQQWGNKTTAGIWSFAKDREVTAPGIVLSLVSGDFGGLTGNDIAVGWRADQSTYVGGLRVYFCDALRIPSSGTDPSGGSVVNMVPALTVGNFDYGIFPATTWPSAMDLAAGVKISATTGALVVYIR